MVEGQILEGLLINAALIVAVMAVLWLIAVQIRDVSFIDAVWGGGMALLAVSSWLQQGEPGVLATLIAAMTVLWGGRLALHLFVRWRAHGEDPRYARMLGKAKERGRFAGAALKIVFGPQFLTFTLTKWSGKPLLEKSMAKRRPDYAAYVERTSGFVPWPPKRG